jgi:hypothetical protein
MDNTKYIGMDIHKNTISIAHSSKSADGRMATEAARL